MDLKTKIDPTTTRERKVLRSAIFASLSWDILSLGPSHDQIKTFEILNIPPLSAKSEQGIRRGHAYLYIFQVSLSELSSVHCTHCHQQGVESVGGVRHITMRKISNFSN